MVLLVMDNLLDRQKNDLANEITTFITNITGVAVEPNPNEGFEFVEYRNFIPNKRSINNSIKEFNILFNVLCENGWEVDTEIEDFDLAIHLTKAHCFVTLSICRNGLHVFFEEI